YAAARAAGAEAREGESRHGAKGASLAGPEAPRQRDEQLVLFAAARGRARRHARPARDALELERHAHAGGRGEMAGVAREAVRQVDHGARAAAREPAPRRDAGLGPRAPPPHAGRPAPNRPEPRPPPPGA